MTEGYVTVDAQCSSCGASGVCKRLNGPEGEGVLCGICHGSGKMILSYIPFTHRNTLTHVRTVRRVPGWFMGTVGNTGGEVSYKDFLSGIMP